MSETSHTGKTPGTNEKPAFYIVDPNLRNVVGHYFEYDRTVAEGAVENGYRTIILANRAVEPAIAERVGAHPVFTRDIWGLAGAGSFLARALGKIRDNGRFLLDLLGAIRRFGLPSGSVIFAHTFVDRQFLALALLPLLLWFRNDVRYVYLLRYQPDFYRDPLSSLAFRLIECLARRRPIHLTTDSARLSDQLGGLTTSPVHVLPIPHVPPAQPDAILARDPGVTTFVSLGNARDEKGIFEILHAIRILHQRGQLGGLRFVLQCNDAAPDVRAEIDHFAADGIPNCELLFDKLDTDEYYRLLWDSDVVLLPYWRSIYFGRTSGVFMEALSAGKPVIATGDTWMSDQLAEHGAGLVCRDRSAEVLAALMLRAAGNRDALTLSARDNRGRWMETHNPRALARAIDSLRADTPAAMAPPRRVLILYPHDDFITPQGGASRRTNLLADFLMARGMTVRVLQGGTAERVVKHGLAIESLGREPRMPVRRLLVGALVWAASLGRGMKHRWIFWQYTRVGASGGFQRQIRQLVRWSDVVALEYPFWAGAVVPIARQEGRRVILTSHDVLTDQMAGLPALKALAWRRELRAWKAANVLMTVSATDQAMMAGQGLAPVLAPNPTDGRLFEVERLGDAHAILRDLFGIELPFSRFCLFVGSLFEPNVLAVESIRGMARALAAHPGGDDIGFVVVGGCCPPDQDGSFLALGRIEDPVLLALYAACDIVLVPIPFGTGSSLKTIEGMAAAKVVLGSAAAFRGLDVADGREVRIEDRVEAYPDAILSVLADPIAGRTMGLAARDFARGYDSRVAFMPYLAAAGLPAASPDEVVEAFGAIDASLIELAQHAQRSGRPGLAAALAREALRTSPGDPDAEAVVLLSADGAEPAASASAVEPVVLPPDPAVVWNGLRTETWERFHAGAYAEVIARVEGLMADGFSSAELHFLLAQCLHNAGRDPDRAWDHYTRAGGLGFPRNWVWANRGRLHRESGRPRRAARDLLLALAAHPYGPSAAMALRELARVAQASRLPTGPRRLDILSEADRRDLWRLTHGGEHAAVIARARAALTQGSDAELHYLLAHALHGAGGAAEEAGAAYGAALEAGWDPYWVKVGRGRLHRECGRSALALRDLVPALVRRPFRRSSVAVAKEIAATIVRWNRVPPRDGG